MDQTGRRQRLVVGSRSGLCVTRKRKENAIRNAIGILPLRILYIWESRIHTCTWRWPIRDRVSREAKPNVRGNPAPTDIHASLLLHVWRARPTRYKCCGGAATRSACHAKSVQALFCRDMPCQIGVQRGSPNRGSDTSLWLLYCTALYLTNCALFFLFSSQLLYRLTLVSSFHSFSITKAARLSASVPV